MRRTRLFIGLVVGALVLSACGQKSFEQTDSTEEQTQTQTQALPLSVSEMFSERELSDVSAKKAVNIKLQDQGSSADDLNCVSIQGDVVTIQKAGIYSVSGALSQGRLVVDVGKKEEVQLIFAGVEIHCSDSAALYVRSADFVGVTLQKDTENILVNEKTFTYDAENNIDGAIFAKSDLSFNGEGSLRIESSKHGIVTKKDLFFVGGNYQVSGESHAIVGKDSVRIKNGSFRLSAGKDAITSDAENEADKGFVYIAGGSYNIIAGSDGLSAKNTLQIDGGSFDVYCGDGSKSTLQYKNAVSENAVSQKGIKSAGAMIINNGTFCVDSADDAFHSNESLTVCGGSFEIQSGDDAFHADDALSVLGGTISVLRSYEGLEGQTVSISGGELSITAEDDGINAAGGRDNSGIGRRQDTFGKADSAACITVSGGNITVNAGGDGLDSNGNLVVSGGKIIVSGATNGGNSAVDYDGTAKITGGIFAATGYAEMAQNFGSESTQGSMLISVGEQSADTSVILYETQGQELISFNPTKRFNSVLISVPQLRVGSTYTLKVGSSAREITMSELIYGTESGGFPGGMNGRPGGMNGRPGGANKRPDNGNNKGSDGATRDNRQNPLPSFENEGQQPAA